MSYESKMVDPAFPTCTYNQYDGSLNGHYKGISVIDYFAVKAMQGILSSQTELRAIGLNIDNIHASLIAKEAYLIADAMLIEKERILTRSSESL